ncbi:class III lanthionine synthetase LanKC N-terminal domain-containing protein [Streptomyces sp. NPDC001492]
MRDEAHCLLDPHFYEAPGRAREQLGDFAQTRRPAPDGWQRSGFGEWVVSGPEGAELPPQGWKIHVSACLDIEFVTVHPADEDRLAVVLAALGAHVRHGGFAHRPCDSPDGATVPAIEDLSGGLVPDVRGPTFRPPARVRLPAVLAPHAAARAGTTVAGLPYRIESALHYFNGGGPYHGGDRRTGQPVMLKEARPYAGLTMHGADAVTRQRYEREALERLHGLDCVPALLDHFVLGGHHFLVEKYVHGARDQQPVVVGEPAGPGPYDGAADHRRAGPTPRGPWSRKPPRRPRKAGVPAGDHAGDGRSPAQEPQSGRPRRRSRRRRGALRGR